MESHNTSRLKIVVVLQLFVFALIVAPSPGMAGKMLQLYKGEVRVIKLERIDRVAIGNPEVASNTILPNGQLVILADSEGVTTMHIWRNDGTEVDYDIEVREKKNMDSYKEISRLLTHMPGVAVSQLDDILVVKGKVSQSEKEQLVKVLEKYKDALNLTTISEDEHIIRLLLQDVPNVHIKEIDGYTVVFGEVNQEYSDLIQRVIAKYPRVLDMTRVQEAVVDQMVHMKVRVMEVNKSVTEKLGINWNTTGIIGPSFEFGVEVSQNEGTLLNSEDTSKVLTTPGGSNLSTARGYFGIASGVASTINLAEGNGDAVVLAEPQLSTRSGGKAEFLAGGEIPMPVTNAQGQVTVEFKKYGIKLNIEPVVDDMGNILAHVETEVSTIDNSVKVADIPGLLSRSTMTEVSLRPKQTLVIAGLVQDLVSKDIDKVKWLGDLPVLGPLFRSKDFSNRRSELVIFITPSVHDIHSSEALAAREKARSIMMEFDELAKGSKLLE